MAAKTPVDENDLESYIEQARNDWSNVGVSVSIVQADQTVYARGFGLKDIGAADRIDHQTLFQVGSTTKAFTAAALGMLVDEGKLQWDARVAEWLPRFQLQSEQLTQQLTIRDLLSHRTGIPHSYFPFLRAMTVDEVLRELRYVTPEATFRNSYTYNNLMYAVAGKVLEAASGLTWHEFIKQRVLKPLGMSRSSTSPYEVWDSRYVTSAFLGSAPSGRPRLEDAREPNVAMPHAWNAGGSIEALPWQSYDNCAAAGSIVSCAQDMANWLMLNLNEGRFAGQQLLNPQTMREIHTAQNPCPPQFPFEDPASRYAMGWIRSEYRGATQLAHGGGIMGFPAYAALMPQLKVGVVVLSNGPTERREEYAFHKSIALWIFDRWFNAPMRQWSQEFLERAQRFRSELQATEDQLNRTRVLNVPPLRSLDRYVGAYEDQAGRFGQVRVSLKDDELFLRFAESGAFCARLEHWQEDVFRIRPLAPIEDVLGPLFVSFQVEGAADVVSLTAFGSRLARL